MVHVKVTVHVEVAVVHVKVAAVHVKVAAVPAEGSSLVSSGCRRCSSSPSTRMVNTNWFPTAGCPSPTAH